MKTVWCHPIIFSLLWQRLCSVNDFQFWFIWRNRRLCTLCKPAWIGCMVQICTRHFHVPDVPNKLECGSWDPSWEHGTILVKCTLERTWNGGNTFNDAGTRQEIGERYEKTHEPQWHSFLPSYDESLRTSSSPELSFWCNYKHRVFGLDHFPERRSECLTTGVWKCPTRSWMFDSWMPGHWSQFKQSRQVEWLQRRSAGPSATILPKLQSGLLAWVQRRVCSSS